MRNLLHCVAFGDHAELAHNFSSPSAVSLICRRSCSSHDQDKRCVNSAASIRRLHVVTWCSRKLSTAQRVSQPRMSMDCCIRRGRLMTVICISESHAHAQLLLSFLEHGADTAARADVIRKHPLLPLSSGLLPSLATASTSTSWNPLVLTLRPSLCNGMCSRLDMMFPLIVFNSKQRN